MGGAPCAGKSSISDWLASQYGLSVYHCDDAFGEHVRRVVPEQHPTLHKWTTSSWDRLWMQPAEVLLAEAKSAYQERFESILQAVRSLPRTRPVLVEATALLPSCVSQWLLERERAIWVVPTEQFLRHNYPDRGPFVQSILSQCQEPERAFGNWMDRDAAFAKWVAEQVRELGLKLMVVDGERSIADHAAMVAKHFRLG